MVPAGPLAERLLLLSSLLDLSTHNPLKHLPPLLFLQPFFHSAQCYVPSYCGQLLWLNHLHSGNICRIYAEVYLTITDKTEGRLRSYRPECFWFLTVDNVVPEFALWFQAPGRSAQQSSVPKAQRGGSAQWLKWGTLTEIGVWFQVLSLSF